MPLFEPRIYLLTRNKILLLLTAILLWLSCAISAVLSAEQKPPALRREFRAAWIATVANIDWPSKRGLSSEMQQQELLEIIEKAAELNLNALVLQVRLHCDAIYPSELEPWSEYLTGKMGVAPDPLYDPLQLVVREAHARGLELHAWFNPYRASHTGARSPWAANHVSHTKPSIVRVYGKHLWLDPAEPDAAEHSLAVILDVVRRYDIDGVHFDDYFYPYPINDPNEKRVPFPDENRWQMTSPVSPEYSRGDWRRQHVDEFIRNVGEEIHRLKPWVKFGISPFGIWRPGHPEAIKGFDAYDNLYADSRKWLREGWVDYLTPQLYWKVESEGQSYPLLLKWWHQQNKQGRHLWPGNFSSRVANESSGNWPAEEILQQIEITRKQEGAAGNVHFSMKSLLDDRGLGEALATGPYREPALVPATPWLEAKPPGKPRIRREDGKVQFSLGNGATPWLWIVQVKSAGRWHSKVLPGRVSKYALSRDGISVKIEQIAVTAVNRLGATSAMQVLSLNKP